jgi:DNA-binding transcriptional MerR regulator
MEKALPAIPAKRYFTIGEVSELCGVKPYVLRYWEQEFTQLKPMKRRGNRRYYQHHEVLLIRRIRDLLYDQGFTISGARSRLTGSAAGRIPEAPEGGRGEIAQAADDRPIEVKGVVPHIGADAAFLLGDGTRACDIDEISLVAMREELLLIRGLLST